MRFGLILLCFFMTAAMVRGQNDCRKIRRKCPRRSQREPVCDTRGRTWTNQCALLRAACRQPSRNVKLAYFGACVRPGRQMQTGPGGGSSQEDSSMEDRMPVTPFPRNTAIPGPGKSRPYTPPPAMPFSCPNRCPIVIDVVCGTDNFTYDSRCYLRQEACRSRDRTLTVSHRGPCQCPSACPLVYEPLCATSNRPGFPREQTYTSDCEMKRDACVNNDKSLVVDHLGECASLLKGQCDIACDPINDPVCSTTNVTYRSQCELDRHRCITQDPTLKTAYSGECPHAPIRCPNLCQPANDPHCGNDGVTYPSLCEYGVAACRNPNLRLRYAGPCVPGTADPCSRICDSYEDPVCATNGETYWNPCLLQLAHCKDQSITLAYRGTCSGAAEGNPVSPVGRKKTTYSAYGDKHAFIGFP